MSSRSRFLARSSARRLPWLLTAALLVTGCQPTDPVPLPPIVDPAGPGALGNQTVALGGASSAGVSADFAGRWSIPELPEWLSVTRRAGTGPVTFTVSAQRAKATPLAAGQPQLSESFKVDWTSPDGLRTGAATVTVTADQYSVTGRVMDAPSVTGTDTGVASRINGEGAAAPRGVIVKYRGGDGAARTPGAQNSGAQSLTAQALGARTLTRAGVGVGGARDLAPRLAALTVSDVPRALAALRADPDVEYAVPNAVLRAQQTAPQAGNGAGLAAPLDSTDQYAGLQWPLRLLGYPAVWRDMEGGAYTREVTVAVIDSGVRFDHPDLAGQLWTPGQGALDVLSSKENGDTDGVDTDPTDPSTPNRVLGSGNSSHGTHVTGIIVARWGTNPTSGCPGCSTTGVAGASYKAPVKVLPIRVIDTQGNAEEADVVSSVRYAAGLPVTLDGQTYTNPHPARVINLSLGGPIDAEAARPMCDAIAEARTQGALTFVAAGNAGSGVAYYPAACPAAVAVGSVSLSGGSAPLHATYSNFYTQVQLSAPGGSDPFMSTTFNGALLGGKPFPDMVFSTSWDYEKDQPNYYAMSGTSQATPQVAALAALLLSKGVTTGPADTLERLLNTATDLGAGGRDEQFGVGMINAAAALNAPAVSDTLGVRLQDAQGHTFQPPLDSLGRFQAWLGDGTYRLVAGRDRDGNGVYGETHEPRLERPFELGQAQPRADLGELTPR